MTKGEERQCTTRYARQGLRARCSWERQRHRLRPLPGLLRHPRQSVYGIIRSNRGVIPRANAGNNNVEASFDGDYGRSPEQFERLYNCYGLLMLDGCDVPE